MKGGRVVRNNCKIMLDRKEYLKNIKTIVVKVGTSTLTHSTGLLNLSRIESIVRQLSNIHNKGIQVVLVSSGAIGAGMGKLGLQSKPKTIPEKQAVAAVGQVTLIHMYQKFFSEYGKSIAQVLLTKEDIADRIRFLNARNAFFSLLSQRVIPIVNENDAVVIDEIKVGDNDTLSALVTSLIDADLLLILSDIEGLYDCNPRTNQNAKIIKQVDKITDEIKKCAEGAGSNLGTGGMCTKIKAAEIATSANSNMVIAKGEISNIINKVVEGEDIGTFFQKKHCHINARKHWIGYSSDIKGNIIVDNGAVEAIKVRHKSLLPSGILKVEGCFKKGEVVSVKDCNDIEIAHGITNYDSNDIDLIKGINTSKIEEKLGYKDYDAVVHVNNLLVI